MNTISSIKVRMGDNNSLFNTQTKILLVEDTPMLQIMHTRFLENFGCHVELAKTGLEALDLAKKGYDAIILDIDLPDLCGISVASAIRNEEKFGKFNKRNTLIALTAFNDSLKQDCYTVGFDDFYTKPIHPDQLKGVLMRWLPSHCKQELFKNIPAMQKPVNLYCHEA